MPYVLFAAFVGVLIMVTVPQWLVRREFLKLDAGHRQAMVRGFAPQGALRWLIAAVVVVGVVGAVTFAKQNLWFAAAFGALIVGLHAYVAYANLTVARREAFPAPFRRVLWLASFMRVGVLLGAWAILLWSLFAPRA